MHNDFINKDKDKPMPYPEGTDQSYFEHDEAYHELTSDSEAFQGVVYHAMIKLRNDVHKSVHVNIDGDFKRELIAHFDAFKKTINEQRDQCNEVIFHEEPKELEEMLNLIAEQMVNSAVEAINDTLNVEVNSLDENSLAVMCEDQIADYLNGR